MVQSAGQAYRLSAGLMQAEFNRGGEFMLVLLRCTQALITQMARTVACIRHHALIQQLCRLLLMSMDRLPTRISP